ncbi:MAG: hypothetical protein K6E50_08225 [Lachnospiraceae bacterium]|nr:hypothetical protein [Lachnospiraceae bacterium]
MDIISQYDDNMGLWNDQSLDLSTKKDLQLFVKENIMVPVTLKNETGSQDSTSDQAVSFEYVYGNNKVYGRFSAGSIGEFFSNMGRGKAMGTKTVVGGIASEYDDQILWIERPEVGAEAAQIMDEREYTPCKITKIISRDDYDSEEAYAEASDALLDESTAMATGEFMTMDGVFYVEIDATGDTEEYESVDFDSVDFC